MRRRWSRVRGPDRDDTNRPRSSPTAGRLAAGPSEALEAMRLEEAPDRVGDLAVALLADDEAVVGVRSERFVLGAEPLGEALGIRLRHDPIQPAADHESR